MLRDTLLFAPLSDVGVKLLVKFFLRLTSNSFFLTETKNKLYDVELAIKDQLFVYLCRDKGDEGYW